jgi:hypothetical protein
MPDKKSAPTRCDEGGQEFIPLFITAKQSERVVLTITLCKSAFLVHVFYDGEKILEANSDDPPKDEVAVTLPKKAPGTYALNWGYQPAGQPWQVRSEVTVDGAVRLRQRKSSESEHPIPHSFVYVEVVS